MVPKCTKIQDWWTVEIKDGHCRIWLGKCSEGQNISKPCGTRVSTTTNSETVICLKCNQKCILLGYEDAGIKTPHFRTLVIGIVIFGIRLIT